MDSKLQDISNDIKRVAGTADDMFSPIMSGKVVAGSIDESGMTVNVLLTIDDNTASGDAESIPTEAVLLSAVSMNNNGFILYPADDSDVIVAEVDGPGQYTLIKCSNLEKVVMIANTLIQFNDGSLGGLVKVADLVTKLNNIENLINNLKTSVNMVVVAGTTADGGAVKAGILAGLGSGISPITVQTDIENAKIKQG